MFASRMERLRSQDNMKMYYFEVTTTDGVIRQYRVYGKDTQEAMVQLYNSVQRAHPDFQYVDVKPIDCPPEFECESDSLP